MKYKILIIMLISSIGFSREPNSSFSKGWDGSVSYGFLSEKNPISFLEFSYLLNIDKQSEFYGTFSYLVFGGGLGLGYKYYTNSKSKSSIFISTCSHISVLGDGYEVVYGISIAPGYSILKKNKSKSKITYRNKWGGAVKATRIQKDFYKYRDFICIYG